MLRTLIYFFPLTLFLLSSSAIAQLPSKLKPQTIPTGMVYIPAGTYHRGEEKNLGGHAKYPEEQPAHEVTISSFFIDETEVTNAQFLKFTTSTNYRTQAERGFSKKELPKAPPEQLVPGALVFQAPKEKIKKWHSNAEWQWWQFRAGANWRHPLGPESSIIDKMNHPVVCVTKEDAEAYAKWADKRLPTEAEWERAARGGKKRALFSWGNHPKPQKNTWPANIFQGEFPHHNTALDGYAGTSPVKSFAPNNYGLFDISGNVWEICSDLFRPDYYLMFTQNPIKDPLGPEASQAISQPQVELFLQGQPIPRTIKNLHPLAQLWVVKGGSFLCHHTYCLRYRPAARHYCESLTPTNHTGFRCAKDLPVPE